ncbi:Rrf2 family transcriptional regulator [Acerihabitans sp. KWT182]|uniref:Rrf2 family transcriptional regulator n=1 Tax=Acerihabitans sp. KWT182 TaxID=3157919 RepID=A0AAU7Q771_9GAMM
MKLTRYTDYALRVIIYLGSRDDGLSSIAEISALYDISRNNLMKVVQDLAHLGYIETIRGRAGGIRLGRPAREINLGTLIRHTEKSLAMVDCSACVIAPVCGLPGVLNEATQAFFAVLDNYTLADLLVQRRHFASIPIFSDL